MIIEITILELIGVMFAAVMTGIISYWAIKDDFGFPRLISVCVSGLTAVGLTMLDATLRLLLFIPYMALFLALVMLALAAVFRWLRWMLWRIRDEERSKYD